MTPSGALVYALAQLKYTWRELEPERDRYDFSELRRDLALLERSGKQLFVQVQDVSFDESIVNVPDYLRQDPVFGGGVALKYEFEDDDESRLIVDGWVARRWDPAVRGRFAELLVALAEEFDGRIDPDGVRDLIFALAGDRSVSYLPDGAGDVSQASSP